jgi:hypothetical protein
LGITETEAAIPIGTWIVSKASRPKRVAGHVMWFYRHSLHGTHTGVRFKGGVATHNLFAEVMNIIAQRERTHTAGNANTHVGDLFLHDEPQSKGAFVCKPLADESVYSSTGRQHRMLYSCKQPYHPGSKLPDQMDACASRLLLVPYSQTMGTNEVPCEQDKHASPAWAIDSNEIPSTAIASASIWLASLVTYHGESRRPSPLEYAADAAAMASGYPYDAIFPASSDVRIVTPQSVRAAMARLTNTEPLSASHPSDTLPRVSAVTVLHGPPQQRATTVSRQLPPLITRVDAHMAPDSEGNYTATGARQLQLTSSTPSTVVHTRFDYHSVKLFMTNSPYPNAMVASQALQQAVLAGRAVPTSSVEITNTPASSSLSSVRHSTAVNVVSYSGGRWNVSNSGRQDLELRLAALYVMSLPTMSVQSTVPTSFMSPVECAQFYDSRRSMVANFSIDADFNHSGVCAIRTEGAATQSKEALGSYLDVFESGYLMEIQRAVQHFFTSASSRTETSQTTVHVTKPYTSSMDVHSAIEMFVADASGWDIARGSWRTSLTCAFSHTLGNAIEHAKCANYVVAHLTQVFVPRPTWMPCDFGIDASIYKHGNSRMLFCDGMYASTRDTWVDRSTGVLHKRRLPKGRPLLPCAVFDAQCNLRDGPVSIIDFMSGLRNWSFDDMPQTDSIAASSHSSGEQDCEVADGKEKLKAMAEKVLRDITTTMRQAVHPEGRVAPIRGFAVVESALQLDLARWERWVANAKPIGCKLTVWAAKSACQLTIFLDGSSCLLRQASGRPAHDSQFFRPFISIDLKARSIHYRCSHRDICQQVLKAGSSDQWKEFALYTALWPASLFHHLCSIAKVYFAHECDTFTEFIEADKMATRAMDAIALPIGRNKTDTKYDIGSRGRTAAQEKAFARSRPVIGQQQPSGMQRSTQPQHTPLVPTIARTDTAMFAIDHSEQCSSFNGSRKRRRKTTSSKAVNKKIGRPGASGSSRPTIRHAHRIHF